MSDPSQIWLYATTLISIALGLIVISLVIIYLRLVRKHAQLKEEKSRMGAAAQKEAEKVIDEARRQSIQMLQEAQERASNMIKEVGFISDQTRNKMLEEIGKVTQGYAKNYQGLLEEAKKEAIGIINNISTNIKGEASREIEVMKSALTQEVQRAQEATRKAIEETLSKVGAEVQAYKKARLERVDTAIFEIIKQASQRVIGKSLNLADREELVMKSLEEAKKENVF